MLHTCAHRLFFNILSLFKNVDEFFTTKNYRLITKSGFQDPTKQKTQLFKFTLHFSELAVPSRTLLLPPLCHCAHTSLKHHWTCSLLCQSNWIYPFKSLLRPHWYLKIVLHSWICKNSSFSHGLLHLWYALHNIIFHFFLSYLLL